MISLFNAEHRKRLEAQALEAKLAALPKQALPGDAALARYRPPRLETGEPDPAAVQARREALARLRADVAARASCIKAHNAEVREAKRAERRAANAQDISGEVLNPDQAARGYNLRRGGGDTQNPTSHGEKERTRRQELAERVARLLEESGAARELEARQKAAARQIRCVEIVKGVSWAEQCASLSIFAKTAAVSEASRALAVKRRLEAENQAKRDEWLEQRGGVVGLGE